MRRRIFYVVLGLTAIAVLLGLAFAGSSTTLAKGVSIDGIDVGGMKAKDARALLDRKSARLANTPLTFVAGGHKFPIRPNELGVTPDWARAVEVARREGDGFGPLGGFKRIGADEKLQNSAEF